MKVWGMGEEGRIKEGYSKGKERKKGNDSERGREEGKGKRKKNRWSRKRDSKEREKK